MELQLETIINLVDDAILSVDEQSIIVFLNEAAARVFGCGRAEALGRSVTVFPALADAVGQLKLAELRLSSDSPRAIRSINVRRAGAEPRPTEALVSCATVQGRKFYTAVLRDISRQQEMEKAVYEARKTQAIAALAGGIAHDFNNILTAIISQIDLAVTAPEYPASLRSNLIYAQTAARRGAELVNKLQVFSGRGQPSFALLDVTELLEQVVFMLKRSIDPKVQLDYLPPAVPLWLVKADSNQLMQALMNLGLNARDAMPKGGRLALSVANLEFVAAAPPRRAGSFVRITVGDTGHGMAPETLSRIFDPYFSTKDASRGPGLGLSIASATVADHGGWMEVESQEGHGTQFHVLLPRSVETESIPREALKPDPKAMEGHERILVVDDEELVRMVTKAVLAYRGYQIIEAEDGEDAVEKYARASPPVDLVLMDLHMPRLNGHDALVRIRAANPQAKAVLLSGGLHDPASEPASDLRGVAFLHKPFENQELIRLVREVLDA